MTAIDTFLDNWTAAERAGDAAALDTYLTDDFLGVGPLGFTLPKPAWLGRHGPDAMSYETYGLDEQQVRTYSDTAVVTARQTAKGTYQGNPVPEVLRATLVLVHESDTWRLATIHMSFIAGTPGAPPMPGH
jgi:ketosteroid isomerase-like protein